MGLTKGAPENWHGGDDHDQDHDGLPDHPRREVIYEWPSSSPGSTTHWAACAFKASSASTRVGSPRFQPSQTIDLTRGSQALREAVVQDAEASDFGVLMAPPHPKWRPTRSDGQLRPEVPPPHPRDTIRGEHRRCEYTPPNARPPVSRPDGGAVHATVARAARCLETARAWTPRSDGGRVHVHGRMLCGVNLNNG